MVEALGAQAATEAETGDRDMSNPIRSIALILALSASAVGMVTSVSANLEVARTTLDVGIFTSFALVITAATYLMPAVARRHALAWGLWLVCLSVVLYGHASFYIAASKRAGSVRADEVETTDKAAAIRASLAAIDGTRTPAEVAGDLAKAQARLAEAMAAAARCTASGNCTSAAVQRDKAQAKVVALQAEAEQAHDARELRQRLIAEAGEHEVARRQAAAEPVDLVIASLLGMEPHSVAIMMGVLKAVVLELVAALMWFIALQPGAEARRPARTEAEPITNEGPAPQAG